jgi:hypothetical protein
MNPTAFREHAAGRARLSQGGIGAAVVELVVDARRLEHRWSCIVSDGHEHHYVNVLAPGLGPFERLRTVVVEVAIERFAEAFPADRRLRQLLNVNPIHITRDGEAYD